MRLRAAALAGLAITMMVLGAAAESSYNPNQEYVPDAASAIAIGRAVLIPIYGAQKKKSEEPLLAQKQGDIWVVSGTLHCGSWWQKILGYVCVGGTAEVKLSAKTGEVLYVTHHQ